MVANVLIRKQRIRLNTPDEQLALQLRKVLDDKLQHDLASMMERIFDHYTSSDLYINIDKLHIDLGTVSADSFGQTFIEQLEPKLITELEKQLHDADSAPFSQVNSASEQQSMALIYFLEKGIYPWWYAQNEQETPAQIFDALTDAGIEKFLRKIISLSSELPADILSRVTMRLFMYLPQTKHPEVLLNLVKLYSDSRLESNVKVLIKNTGWLSQVFSIPERAVYGHVLISLLQQQQGANENFIKNLFKKISSEEDISVELLKAYEIKNSIPDEEIVQAFAALMKSAQSGMKGEPFEERAEKKNRGNENLPDEAIYVGNAGLLLLHPFLSYLFTDLGLLTETKQFISVREQNKATVLLYYLQTGKADYKEWEMALNKILCGMRNQDILPNDIVLSAADKENCDGLLQAVISHWEALKGAGIDALRNTFLLREGKISQKEDHWLIQVERTGADILLDRLPWGYSTVKLPWLSQLILTEW